MIERNRDLKKQDGLCDDYSKKVWDGNSYGGKGKSWEDFKGIWAWLSYPGYMFST